MSDILGVPSIPLGASTAGPRLTISAILKQPTFVQAYLLSIADYMFVADKLFRPVQDCPAGVVVYNESTPLFADSDAADLEEFEEIPTGVTGLGAPASVQARRKGLAVEVSYQMQTRNDINALNIQLEQVRNTLIRNFDGKFMSALDAAVVTAAGQGGGARGSHVVAAGAPWALSGNTTYPNDSVRTDLATAAATITTEQRGFRPDTLLIDESTYWDFMANQATWQIYRGDIAGQSPQILGQLPGKILGFTPMVTMDGNIPAGSAYLLQRGMFGGISNERPLQATPWYLVRQKEVTRSDVTRSAAAFVDQPLAVAKITGVR